MIVMFLAETITPQISRSAKLHMVSRRTRAVRQFPVFSATRMALAMAEACVQHFPGALTVKRGSKKPRWG